MIDLANNQKKLYNLTGDNCESWADAYITAISGDAYLGQIPGIKNIEQQHYEIPDGFIWSGHVTVIVTFVDGTRMQVDNGGIAAYNPSVSGPFTRPSDTPKDWEPGVYYPALNPVVLLNLCFPPPKPPTNLYYPQPQVPGSNFPYDYYKKMITDKA